MSLLPQVCRASTGRAQAAARDGAMGCLLSIAPLPEDARPEDTRLGDGCLAHDDEEEDAESAADNDIELSTPRRQAKARQRRCGLCAACYCACAHLCSMPWLLSMPSADAASVYVAGS